MGRNNNCLMYFVTCVYLINQIISAVTTLMFILAIIIKYTLTAAEIFLIIWSLSGYFFMLTSLLMFVPYDDVLSFICINCGNCDNN